MDFAIRNNTKKKQYAEAAKQPKLIAKDVLKVDGYDHIQVHLKSPAPLGKVCDIDFRCDFSIPNIGEFNSPFAFAYWVLTGQIGGSKGMKTGGLSKDELKIYMNIVYLGKFYQMLSLKKALIADINLGAGQKTKLDLPFYKYRIHKNGLKELLPDQSDIELFKEMVRYIVNETKDKPSFVYKGFNYAEVLSQVNRILFKRKVHTLEDLQKSNDFHSIQHGYETLALACSFY